MIIPSRIGINGDDFPSSSKTDKEIILIEESLSVPVKDFFINNLHYGNLHFFKSYV